MENTNNIPTKNPFKKLAQKFASMSKQTKWTLALGTPVLAGLVTTTTLACVFAGQRGKSDLNEIKSLNINLKSPIKNENDKLTADDVEVEAVNQNDTTFIVQPGSGGYSIEPKIGYTFTSADVGKKKDVTITYKGIVQKTSIYVQQSVTPTTKVVLHFDLDGGELISGQTDVNVTPGTKFSEINRPEFYAKSASNVYYRFDYWMVNDTKVDDDLVINENTTVKAHYATETVLNHQLVFDLAGGAQTKNKGESTMLIHDGTTWKNVAVPIITREGYSVTGYTWEDDEGKIHELKDEFEFSSTRSRSYTIKISWIKNETPTPQHTVTFEAKGGFGGGEAKVNVDDHSWLSQLNRPVVKPYIDTGTSKKMVPTGYWTVDGTRIEHDYEFVGDTTLTAEYEEAEAGKSVFKVKFDPGENGHFTSETDTYERSYETTDQVSEMQFSSFKSKCTPSGFPDVEGNISQGKDESEYELTTPDNWSIKDSWNIYEGTTIAVAQWKKKDKYSVDIGVTFEAPEGMSGIQWSGSRVVILHDTETKFGDISKPTITISSTEYAFAGWIDKNTGKLISDDTPITASMVATASFVSTKDQAKIIFANDSHVQKIDVKPLEGSFAGKTWGYLVEKKLIPDYSTDTYWNKTGWYIVTETTNGKEYKKITDSYIIPKGEITVTACAESQMMYDDWITVNAWSTGENEGDDGADKIREHYGFDTKDEMIGLERTVKINGQKHKVRLVDYNHDSKGTNGEGKKLTAALTFEFVNPICDANGKSLALFWKYQTGSLSECRYKDSEIYEALDANTDIAWFTHKSQYRSGTYKTNLRGMLGDDATGEPSLVKVLNGPNGMVQRKLIPNSGAASSYTVPFWLPTAYEINAQTTDFHEEGTDSKYKYYDPTSGKRPASDYVKRQINNSYVEDQKYRAYIGEEWGWFTTRWSVAGGNINKTTNGIQYWLGSFASGALTKPENIFWDGKLNNTTHGLNDHALPIAPFFGIGLTIEDK